MEHTPGFFAVPHPAFYMAALAAAFLGCGLWFAVSAQKKKLPAFSAPLALLIALLAGGFLARLLYLLVEIGDLPLVAEMFFRPEDVREFGFAGAVLGAVFALWLTQKLFHVKGLADAAALPGLTMVLLARLAEIFVPFGTGKYIEAPLLQWVPLCLPDGFGSWQLSVFLFEAAWALFSLFYVKKQALHRFAAALCCYHAGQMFLESLRAESLRYGFVRVSQLIAAVVLFALLILMGRGQKKNLQRILIYLGCVILYIAFEFGLDRLPWPALILRTAMAAAGITILLTVMGAIRGHTSSERTSP